MRALHDLFQPLPLANQVLLILLVSIAGVIDSRVRRIPNWLTLTAIPLAIALNWFLLETRGLLVAVTGAGIAFAIYFVLYLLRGMGAGDVKLMAAVGAITGPIQWFGILIVTSVVSIISAIFLIASKRRFRKTAENLATIITSVPRGRPPYLENPELDVKSDRALRMPHAVLIAFGTFGFLFIAMFWKQ